MVEATLGRASPWAGDWQAFGLSGTPDLEDGCRRRQGCRYQIVLRELQTLSGHPDRLHVWTRLPKEAAARFA
jgi:hypothetical protein